MMILCLYSMVGLFLGELNQESILVSLLSLTLCIYGFPTITFIISHIFLYALITDDSICFPSMFIQTIVDIYRSTSKAKKLFFPMYIYRILRFLRLLDFPPLELVHITALIGATFLRWRQVQIKSAEPSTGTLKRS